MDIYKFAMQMEVDGKG